MASWGAETHVIETKPVICTTIPHVQLSQRTHVNPCSGILENDVTSDRLTCGRNPLPPVRHGDSTNKWIDESWPGTG